MDLFAYDFMVRAFITAALAGAVCGIVGVWVVLLNIPFISVAMAHAAFAGAVFGVLLGVHPLLSAVVCCTLSALVVGPLADRARMSANASLSVVFSLVLGAAFMGIGFIRGPKTEVLNYLWGNILTVSPAHVRLLVVLAALIGLFLAACRKEILAILYDREIARSAGIRERGIFYLLLSLTGIAVALNIGTAGGLLIFSLVTTTPLAARQVTRSLPAMYAVSAAFGMVACFIGLAVSFWWSVPTGASIIIASGTIFGICLLISLHRRNPV